MTHAYCLKACFFFFCEALCVATLKCWVGGLMGSNWLFLLAPKAVKWLAPCQVLLNFLKQHGALLSSLRRDLGSIRCSSSGILVATVSIGPEHFLSHENYLQYQQSMNVGITRRRAALDFWSISPRRPKGQGRRLELVARRHAASNRRGNVYLND